MAVRVRPRPATSHEITRDETHPAADAWRVNPETHCLQILAGYTLVAEYAAGSWEVVWRVADPDDGQPALPVFGPPPGSAPTYASGGVVRGPGPVLVGEHGPEMWPGHHAVTGGTSTAPDGHSHMVTVHLDGRVIDQAVQQSARRFRDRNGPHSI